LIADVPALHRVDYDTIRGSSMIVFDRGTASYNKRIHGGEIELRSVLGRVKYIHVNCTGYAMEGRYPAED